MGSGIYENIWDDKIELFSGVVRHDAKYKVDKKALVFWYVFGKLPNWDVCFSLCDGEYLSKEWVTAVNDALEDYDNLSHWMDTITLLMGSCVSEVKPSGEIENFISTVFHREATKKCDPVFLYTLYLCMYMPVPEKCVGELLERSNFEFMRDTMVALEKYRSENTEIDIETMMSLCKPIYSM